MRNRSAALLLSALAAIGCAGTGQPEAPYEAVAVGAAPREVLAGDWTITLEEARVAFGPAYFCASATAGEDICEEALAEIAAVAAVDALDPSAQPLRGMRGYAGEIKSVAFDYGIHQFTTESKAVAAPEAPGGHSAVLRGRAARADGAALSFTAAVDVKPQKQGQRAVTSLTTSAAVGEEGIRLEVRFDPQAWIAEVDFDELAAGGAAEVMIAPGDRAHNALVIAMGSQLAPAFTWQSPP